MCRVWGHSALLQLWDVHTVASGMCGLRPSELRVGRGWSPGSFPVCLRIPGGVVAASYPHYWVCFTTETCTHTHCNITAVCVCVWICACVPVLCPLFSSVFSPLHFFPSSCFLPACQTRPSHCVDSNRNEWINKIKTLTRAAYRDLIEVFLGKKTCLAQQWFWKKKGKKIKWVFLTGK